MSPDELRDSDKSRCRGDTPRQPRSYADLIKAKKPASVDRRQHRAKLDRGDFCSQGLATHGRHLGRHDCIMHDVWVTLGFGKISRRCRIGRTSPLSLRISSLNWGKTTRASCSVGPPSTHLSSRFPNAAGGNSPSKICGRQTTPIRRTPDEANAGSRGCLLQASGSISPSEYWYLPSWRRGCAHQLFRFQQRRRQSASAMQK